MPTLWADSFTLYNTPSLGFDDIAGLVGMAATGGPEPGNGLLGIFDGGHAYRLLPGGGLSHAGMGISFQTDGPPAGSSGNVFGFAVGPVGSSLTVAQIQLGGSGSFVATAGNGSSTSATGLWRQNSWGFLEATCSVSFSPPNTLSVLIIVSWNGSVIAAAGGTVTTTFPVLSMLGPSWQNGGRNGRWSNWYVTDGAVLGDSTVISSLPNGVGQLAQWTPNGAAQNWQCVDDAPPNLGTTSVTASASSMEDEYAFPALSFPTGAHILGVQVNTFAKTDASTVSLYALIYVSLTLSSYANPTPFTITTSYAYNRYLFAQNPSTSAAWGLTEIGGTATQFGQLRL